MAKNSLLSALLILAAAPLTFAAPAKNDDVLVTVNGTQIRRGEAMERTWRQAGTIVLNQMADEILIKQAADAAGVKADEKEIQKRLKRAQSEFKDEAAFRARLAENGTTLEILRAQISDQVMREGLLIKAKNIKVTESEAAALFEANKAKLSAPAVHLRHIVASTEKDAEGFQAALRAGADFARLAAQVSIDAATRERGGDLGFVPKGASAPEVEEKIFALKAGEISASVKVGEVYHLFKVEEIRPAKPAVFAEMKADLIGAVFTEKISKAWPLYLQELREKAKYEKGSL